MKRKVQRIINALNRWWELRRFPERLKYQRFLERNLFNLDENGDINTILGHWIHIRRRSDGRFNQRDIQDALRNLDLLIETASFMKEVIQNLEQEAESEGHGVEAKRTVREC